MAWSKTSGVAKAVSVGVVAALVILSMPVGLIETVTASIGLGEVLPAAAPPLGFTARLLVAGFGAIMTMGLIWSLRREQAAPSAVGKTGRDESVQGVSRMGFALSKLSWLARGRERTRSGRRIPALRRADAHPDAPARAPIFASRDFGGSSIFADSDPVDDDIAAAEMSEDASISPAALLTDMANRAEPVDAEFDEIVPPAASDGPEARVAAVSTLSIAELTARLEQGLAQRTRMPRRLSSAMVIADMPPESPVPVRESVEEDVDEALRSALGTLRSMAGRSR